MSCSQINGAVLGRSRSNAFAHQHTYMLGAIASSVVCSMASILGLYALQQGEQQRCVDVPTFVFALAQQHGAVQGQMLGPTLAPEQQEALMHILMALQQSGEALPPQDLDAVQARNHRAPCFACPPEY